MAKVKKRSECPVSSSLDLWGDKWSLLIIRDLMYAKECTYGDFLKSKEKIATNILASRLETLEENDFISKNEHPESKTKYLYQLTEKGISLLPVLIEIYLWGEKQFTLSEKHKSFFKEIKKDKEGFLKRASENLRASL